MFSAAIGNRIRTIIVTNWEEQVTKMYHLLVTASETDEAAIGSSQIAMILSISLVTCVRLL